MGITIAGQTWLFLLSIALGAGLGVCYDLFRILRIALPHPTLAVLAEDLLFSVICAGATFFYMLAADNGQIRIFVLIGEGVGFLLYYCTIGALVIRVSKGIIRVVRWVLRTLWRIFVAPIVHLLEKAGRFGRKILHKSSIILKKQAKNLNIPLKKRRKILYNLKK